MAARPRPNSVEYGNAKTTVHCCPRLNVRVHSSKVELAAAGLCVFGGRGRRMRTLCIQRTLSRHVTIGTPMVIFCCLTVFWLFWLFLTNGTLYQSSIILKTIGVPIVTGLPRLYQQCTNGIPIVKNTQKQSKDGQNGKNDHWCTNRNKSTKTVPTV